MAIRTCCTTQRVLPESPLGKAIRYTLDLWDGLAAFLTHPALPLDTNHVERGLRALALGRKNRFPRDAARDGTAGRLTMGCGSLQCRRNIL